MTAWVQVDRNWTIHRRINRLLFSIVFLYDVVNFDLFSQLPLKPLDKENHLSLSFDLTEKVLSRCEKKKGL